MYRKPAMGMWDYLVSKENDGIKVDMKASMFVGGKNKFVISACMCVRECMSVCVPVNVQVLFKF